MNYDELHEYIVQHGGGTLDAYGRNLKDCKRYAVAIYPEFSFAVPTLTAPLIESSFVRYRKVFDEPYNGGLGFWFNEADKVWYIEAVILCVDSDVAKSYARDYKQVAYYHLDCTVPPEQRCIYIGDKS